MRLLVRPVTSYLYTSQFRCLFLDARRALFGLPPSLSCWLSTHPAVAASVKWQFTFQTSAYDIPETAKRAWPSWSVSEQNELIVAFEEAWNWLYGSAPFANLNETIPDPPVNLADTSNQAGRPYVQISGSAARELYLRWLGLNFAVELGGHVPWSVSGYTAEQLQILFDSASFLSRLSTGNFVVCAGSPEHVNYVKRKDNVGGSLIGPPRFTLAFLRNSNLVGPTRQATIANLLNWVQGQPRALLRRRGLPDDGAALAVSRAAADFTRRVRHDVDLPRCGPNVRALDRGLPRHDRTASKRVESGKHPRADPSGVWTRAG